LNSFSCKSNLPLLTLLLFRSCHQATHLQTGLCKHKIIFLKCFSALPKSAKNGLRGNPALYVNTHSCLSCQMVYFQTKNPTMGKRFRALYWKMLIYLVPIWNILLTFWIFYDHLLYFLFIGYIFPVLVSCTKKIWQPWVWSAAKLIINPNKKDLECGVVHFRGFWELPIEKYDLA
jgi:hypothetical protein